MANRINLTGPDEVVVGQSFSLDVSGNVELANPNSFWEVVESGQRIGRGIAGIGDFSDTVVVGEASVPGDVVFNARLVETGTTLATDSHTVTIREDDGGGGIDPPGGDPPGGGGGDLQTLLLVGGLGAAGFVAWQRLR